MEFIKPGRQFDFMSKRWLFIGFSGLLLLLSIIGLFKPGPHLGTDFKGGTEVEIAFTGPVEAGEVRGAVEALGFEAPDVIRVKDSGAEGANRYLIRVQEVSALSDQQKAMINDRLCHLAEGAPSSPE